MFKKLLCAAGLTLMLGFATACGGEEAPAPAAAGGDTPATGAAEAPAAPAPGGNDDWRIGIITGTVSQGEEEFLAAQNMVARFGSDRVITATYPDRFAEEMETTIANVMSLADRGANVIVFVQAVPGAIAAMQHTRELFPDVMFITGTSAEHPRDVAELAEIALLMDDISAGTAIMEQAYAMGATTFIHYSFPRHLGMENIARRRQLLYDSAARFGIEWHDVTAPDPVTGEGGIPAAQQFIMEDVPRQVAAHGPDTALFSTNCAMQEPLIRQVLSYGALFPLQCCPSPFHAFPGALNISMEGREGDARFIIEQIGNAVSDAGMEGRMSTWPAPMAMLMIEVGTIYAYEYLNGRTDGRQDFAALQRIINQVGDSYGAEIFKSNWEDEQGTIDNFFMLLADFVTF